VHSFGGSGIEMIGMDYVTVENNVVYNLGSMSRRNTALLDGA
jgi:hypothetical protein